MNDAALNSYSLNGPTTLGNNAILSGGISIGSTLSAVTVVTAILTGGIFSVSDAQGAVSTKLEGGIVSLASVGGAAKITTVLQGGIYSLYSVGGPGMSFDPSLKDGVYSPSGFGGQLLCSPRLQMQDQVGQLSVAGGSISIDKHLNGGCSGTSYLGGGIRGSLVLLGDGLKSTSQVGSNVLKSGMALSGGVYSTPVLGGTLFYPAKLSGGILGTWELGKEFDIEAKLQGGVMQTCSPGGGLLISPVCNGGIENSYSFGANRQLSPAANGGVSSSAFLASTMAISNRLQNGVFSSTIVGGKGITASQILRDGITSTTGITIGGQIKTHAKLQGALSSSAFLHGDIVQGFLDPLLNTWALEIRSATVLLEIQHPSEDI